MHAWQKTKRWYINNLWECRCRWCCCYRLCCTIFTWIFTTWSHLLNFSYLLSRAIQFDTYSHSILKYQRAKMKNSRYMHLKMPFCGLEHEITRRNTHNNMHYSCMLKALKIGTACAQLAQEFAMKITPDCERNRVDTWNIIKLTSTMTPQCCWQEYLVSAAVDLVAGAFNAATFRIHMIEFNCNIQLHQTQNLWSFS